MQPETAASRPVGGCVPGLVELAEDRFMVLGDDAEAIVADVHLHAPVPLVERDLDPPIRRGAKLGCVGKQVQHDLDHPVQVGGDARNGLWQAGLHADALLLEKLVHGSERVGDHFLHVDPGFRPVGLARFQLGEVEYLVDEARKPFRLLGDDP